MCRTINRSTIFSFKKAFQTKSRKRCHRGKARQNQDENKNEKKEKKLKIKKYRTKKRSRHGHRNVVAVEKQEKQKEDKPEEKEQHQSHQKKKRSKKNCNNCQQSHDSSNNRMNCQRIPTCQQNNLKNLQNNIPNRGNPTYNQNPQMIPKNFTFAFPQSPFVDCQRKSIYFCDSGAPVFGTSFFRYDIPTGRIYGANITNVDKFSPDAATCIPIKGNSDKFMCTIDKCLCHVTWDGVSPTAVRTDDAFCLDSSFVNIFTDYACTSPNGKLYFVTFNLPSCSANETAVFEYDPKTGAVTQRISGLHWTNGCGFDPCTNTFYLNNDCDDFATNAYQWDYRTGSLSE